jgi:NADH:ubiquinone oxidoreductase subunit 6 (subunit J)
MWAVIAVVAFAVALILRLAEVSRGVVWTWETWGLIGLLALAVAHVSPGWPWRSSPQ